ncbi:MAG: leucine-rich repeat domain-containing protein, partial [Anaeroplasmataceae bacterium]|nr:leucine-rich repeat domain-containing protein [Anaeroplasmataceae bacterium]
AFYQYTLLETILLTTEQLQTIGKECFYGCTKLVEIEIPSTVTTIGDSSFENCTALTTVTNYEGISALGNKMFKGCIALENFEIKDNIVTIGDSCFEDCVSLGKTEIVKSVWDAENEEWIPGTPTAGYKPTIDLNQVETIGSQAFRGCTYLVTITLPSTITEIGSYAFENCTDLTTLVHETTVLGDGIFKGCIVLDNVEINTGTLNINDEAFMDCVGLTNITLPGTVTRIGDHTFENCTALTEILLPETLEYIGENAFKNSGLTYIVIPQAVVEIGDYAFESSLKLKKATFNNSVLGLGMFKDCTDLRNAYITIGVTVIPKEAFMNCESLTLVALHNEYLAYTQAYDSSCSNDVKVEMSDLTVKILESAFENCISIDNVNFEHILYTGNRAFFNTGLTHVEIPETIEHLGEELFASCKMLELAIVLYEELSVRIFMDCISLDNMNIVEGTTIIPKQAFKNCESLTNLVIPYSLREFHKEAFMNTNIPEITINPDVVVIEESVFADCDNLTKAIIYTDFLGLSMFAGSESLTT